jgi:ATP-dependent exoDNAse (exonuclease V) beta subunit
MKENFRNAIENYEFSGYFNQAPTKAVCEKTFSFTIDELPNVVFDGRIDAILSDEKNNTTVIDYKTGRNKINTLEYAISEFGVNFKSKTGKDPSNIETLQNTYDYQIPIYYLAIQNAENLKEYKESVKKLGLLYVRPITKDNGCDEDFVSAEKIEFYKEKIIQNLKTTIQLSK